MGNLWPTDTVTRSDTEATQKMSFLEQCRHMSPLTRSGWEKRPSKWSSLMKPANPPSLPHPPPVSFLLEGPWLEAVFRKQSSKQIHQWGQSISQGHHVILVALDNNQENATDSHLWLHLSRVAGLSGRVPKIKFDKKKEGKKEIPSVGFTTFSWGQALHSS